MALSNRALRSLGVGLVSDSLAQELAAASISPTSLSDKLKLHLEVGLASTKIKNEVVAAVEAGSTALSEDAKRHIIIMMADPEDGQELINDIEA